MGSTLQSVGKLWCLCLDLGKNLCDSGPGVPDLWVADVGDDTVYWEGVGRIPPQGDLQADGTATSEGGVWEVDVYLTGIRYGGGGVIVGGYLCLPPPEHSHTVHCNQAHYVPVSGSG